MLFSNKSLFSKVNILILVRYSVPSYQTNMEAWYAIAYHPLPIPPACHVGDCENTLQEFVT